MSPKLGELGLAARMPKYRFDLYVPQKYGRVSCSVVSILQFAMAVMHRNAKTRNNGLLTNRVMINADDAGC